MDNSLSVSGSKPDITITDEDLENALSVENTETSQNDNESNNQFENFGFGNIIDMILSFWANSVSQETYTKVKMNDLEIRTVNIATGPLLMKLLEKLGLEVNMFSALASVVVIVFPRVVTILNDEKVKKQNARREQKTETNKDN